MHSVFILFFIGFSEENKKANLTEQSLFSVFKIIIRKKKNMTVTGMDSISKGNISQRLPSVGSKVHRG